MLQQQTLDFLIDLKENNNREWFLIHKKRYEAAKVDFLQLTSNLLVELSTFDTALAGLTAKKCIFRINRDVRFSKDKSPYKVNIGAHFVAGGKKSGLSGYYFHLEPHGKSFAGGGLYMPPSNQLKLIRQEIDYNGVAFQQIIDHNNFKARFGSLSGRSLKIAPKGYPKDHPHIELLRLKDYVVSQQISDKMLCAKNLVPTIINIFKIMKPLIGFLNQTLHV